MKRQNLRNVSRGKALRGWLTIVDSFFDDQQSYHTNLYILFSILCYDLGKNTKSNSTHNFNNKNP